ncbi:hypothetical protein [Polaromonas sp. CG_9.11]|uniref:hypothetical protein n=1 Tax=Polaromonas sp. CG_9.11 TaxID=2787730 RepID=UPI0018C9BB62|nr:hypothetical protein [Polaromonas sp. CG_9.11]MBG6077977.1 hypothetical protein [Polaromonas sp. CG_9.11]
MIDLFNNGCKFHPDVMMSFDKEKSLWLCDKCDAFAASIKEEIELPIGSISTSKTNSANSFTDLGPSKSADGLAEKAARIKVEELNFLEFIKNQEEARTKPIELNKENGYYIGSVIYADTTRAAQRSSRSEFVIHDQLNPPLTKDNLAIEIKYKDGFGVVLTSKFIDKSLGR